MKHNRVRGMNFRIKTPALYLRVGLTVMLEHVSRIFNDYSYRK